MLYDCRFFKEHDKARSFCIDKSGAMFSNLPGSPTAEEYRIEADIQQLSPVERECKPFCVVWNIVEEGPIQPIEPLPPTT